MSERPGVPRHPGRRISAATVVQPAASMSSFLPFGAVQVPSADHQA